MGKTTSLDSVLNKFKSDLGFVNSLLLGLVISASGSMMLGALHLIAIQINLEKGWQAAILFSCGCAFVEGIFVRYLAQFTRWISNIKHALVVMEWIVLFLFLGLAMFSFWTAFRVTDQVEAVITPSLVIPTFFLGMGIRFLYPSMIPFWLAWNTVLVTRKIQFQIIPFAIGAGVATVFMHAIYIFAGHLLMDFLKDKNQEMLLLIGGVFLLTAIFQVKRMFVDK